MTHVCGCVHCMSPYPFDDQPGESHAAVRFTRWSPRLEVRLNGKRLGHCFEADVRAGMVAITVPDDSGRYHLAPCGQHICSGLRHGTVELTRVGAESTRDWCALL